MKVKIPVNFEGIVLLKFRSFTSGSGAFGFITAFLLAIVAVIGPSTAFGKQLLQNRAARPVDRMDLEKWAKRQTMLESTAKNSHAKVLFLGDSITQGWTLTSVWDQFYGRYAFNAGIEGDRTEHVLWRLKRGLIKEVQPEVVVLLVGTNNIFCNRVEHTADAIFEIIKEIKRQKSDTKILLHALLPAGRSPDEKRRLENQKLNQLLRQRAGEAAVSFVDFSDVFVDDKGFVSKDIMPDYLHPSKKAYLKWAKVLTPEIEHLLAKKSL